MSEIVGSALGGVIAGKIISGTLLKVENLDIPVSQLRDILSIIRAKMELLTFDSENRLAIQNPPYLDVALSTRASEATLSGIKAQIDRLTFDSAGNLQVSVVNIPNPPALDTNLSTRASEATLSKIAGALASIGADKLRVSPVDPLPLSPFNLTQINGVALTPRDWSSDFAMLRNIDVALSTRASEATLSSVASYTKDVRDVLTRISIDASGNLGVSIKSPVDGNGNIVVVSPPATVMELTVEGTTDTIRGQTISSGSLTSNPIDVLGLREWELIVDADDDFTVEIQYLAPSGNWRTFDTYSSTNMRLHLLVDERLPQSRIVITPLYYPTTINEAFVVMVR